MTTRPFSLLSAVALGVLLAGSGSASAQDHDDELVIPDGAEPARYVENIDGDTIMVELENRNGIPREYTVRLIGIDTPETSYSYGNEPECFGMDAKNKTDSLLVTAEDNTIWLEADEADRDPYGRLLRYVWYVSEIDGDVHFLNEDLVREGNALAKTYQPNTARQDELDDAEDDAIRAAAGMWLECDASVSMDPSLEENGEPDDEDAEVACAMFDIYDEAQDLLDEFPELADELDADGDGIACETYFDVG